MEKIVGKMSVEDAQINSFNKRIYLASIVEIYGIMAWSLYVIARNYYNFYMPNVGSVDTMIAAIGRDDSIMLLFVLFISTIFFMLFRRSLLVGLTVAAVVRKGHVSARLEPGQPRNKVLDEKDPEFLFSAYIKRSVDAASFSQRRPNVLLFVGCVVAATGLAFFIMTLPEIRPGDNIENHLLNMIPRFFMLIFIQVLAGFFLRQYRAAMEDFRYYEYILRYREAQHLSYRVVLSSGDKERLAKFADILLQEKEFGIGPKNLTALSMEAYKSSNNEFEEIVRKAIDKLDFSKFRGAGSNQHGSGEKSEAVKDGEASRKT